MSRRRSTRRGFSLVELATILAIVACLVAIVIPAVFQAREAARRSSCKNNLKQLVLGLHNYHDVYGTFSMGWQTPHPDDPTGADSWAWSVALMPYLE